MGCHIYSQDGRVFQIEYAEKAVEKGGSLIGVRCKDGVVLLAEKMLRENLYLPRSGSLVHKIDTKSGLAFTGYYQDGRAIVPMAETECENYRDYYGEDIPPHCLADRLAEYMHAHTTYGGYRPLGIGVLLTGFDELEGRAFLHMVSSKGVTYRFFGAAIGKGRQAATTELEKLQLEDLTCEEALEAVAEIILTISDVPVEKTAILEGGWIKDKEQHFSLIPADLLERTKQKAQQTVKARDAAVPMES